RLISPSRASPAATASRRPRVLRKNSASVAAALRASASPPTATIVVARPSANSPAARAIFAGLGITAGSSWATAHADATISKERRAELNRPALKRRLSPGSIQPGDFALELDPHGEVVLPAVRVERARLVGVGAVHLQYRIVEIQRVEVQRQVAAHVVVERGRQHAGVVLVLRRAAVEPDKEVRPVRVVEARAEAAVLVIRAQVVRVLRRADELADAGTAPRPRIGCA